MAVHSGTAGSAVLVINGTAAVDSINQWTANFSREEKTWEKFGSTMKQRLLGSGDVSGNIRGHWDQGDTNGQVKLKNAYLGGSVVELRLYDTVSQYWAGSAYLTSVGETVQQEEIVSCDFGFSGVGSAWTYT